MDIYDAELNLINVAQELTPMTMFDPENLSIEAQRRILTEELQRDYSPLNNASMARSLAASQLLINQHTREELERSMPYITATHATIPEGLANLSGGELSPNQVPPAPPAPAPTFTVSQNTQAAELTTLREQYPAMIFHYNFQTTSIAALHEERRHARDALRIVHRTKAVVHVWANTPAKYKEQLRTIIGANYSSRQWREITLGDITETSHYRSAIEALEHYRQRRTDFLERQKEYASAQAQYNQRAAMIRQRPNRPRIINTQEIVETVAVWDNVWGISVKANTTNGLKVRVGLCNIIMTESAEESAYDMPVPIRLAPFYITLNILSDGRFVCRSGEENTAGLSGQGNNPGGIHYDIHPHQLSDSPCFGTFGQTFLDLASKGDIITLISGLIAFYSQYNSQDSAGVAATNFHPANIGIFENEQQYVEELTSRVTGYRFHHMDPLKLSAAMAMYREYHEEEGSNTPPQRQRNHNCYNCEDIDVADEGEYFCDTNGERICLGCWENSYCSDCERHCEDCVCDDDNYE